MKLMSHLPPHPHPPAPSPQKKKKCLFRVEEIDKINIGISLKACAFSHMMHEKLGPKVPTVCTLS